jgi:uncharacterized membrane protein YeaQ/YmgE (transglycosylase-associated protein family)
MMDYLICNNVLMPTARNVARRNVLNNNQIYMGVILWIVFGGLVGWVASLIMKTDGQQGIFLNIVFGVVGAVVGGWAMSFIGQTGISGFNLYSFVVALVGAVIFIAAVKMVRPV